MGSRLRLKAHLDFAVWSGTDVDRCFGFSTKDSLVLKVLVVSGLLTWDSLAVRALIDSEDCRGRDSGTQLCLEKSPALSLRWGCLIYRFGLGSVLQAVYSSSFFQIAACNECP